MARNKEQNENFYIDIGVRLRILREEKGFSLDQLSEQLHRFELQMSANMLGKIERGESRIQAHTLFLIAEFYQTDLSFFSNKTQLIHPFKNLLDNPAGRECLLHLSEYSDDPDILEFMLDFIKLFNYRIRNHFGKKSEIMLKASSGKRKI